jgi:hypothetical protein
LFFEFVRGADESGRPLALINVEPPSTRDRCFDALLAAVAEHVTPRYGLAGPFWSVAVDRFLDTPW